MREPFLDWGQQVITAAAKVLDDAIPSAATKRASNLAGYVAVYVHFRDEKVPQSLALWLYATRAGAAYNVNGRGDVIAVGLKHDSNDELDRLAWRFRRPTPFAWYKHVDDRWEGYRLLFDAEELPDDPLQASEVVARRVLAVLRRIDAIKIDGRAGRESSGGSRER